MIYRKQLGQIDRTAMPGDLVQLVAPDGSLLGYGLFNPRAELAVRRLTMADEVPDEAWWRAKLARAIDLRQNLLKLPASTTAYRLVHAEADGLPGLVVDRLGDVIAIEAFTVGTYQRAQLLADAIIEQAGAKHWYLRPGPHTLEQEGFVADFLGSAALPDETQVMEAGANFHVSFTTGHKTGYFCDQRDNRQRFAQLAAGQDVLDLCCYTGGFAILALKNGAKHATCIDLDETALALAQRNAKLNRVQPKFQQSDVFEALRKEQRVFGAVVLDPPKLIRERAEEAVGHSKYFDMNRLAMQRVAPDGLFVTCSCSGLLGGDEFQRLVAAAVPEGRSAQLLNRTGAAPDHPVDAHIPEGEYLKALWYRLS